MLPPNKAPLWAIAAAILVGFFVLVSCAPNPGLAPTMAYGGCYVCHPSQIAAMHGSHHEKVGVGCITCHGLSKAHAASRAGAVKPDAVYTRPEVDLLCDGCHFTMCKRSETDKRLPRGALRHTCADCHDAHQARIHPSR